MFSLVGIAVFSIGIAAGMGYALGCWLPRFSAGIAGPGLLLFCGYVTFAHQELFDTSGSVAMPIDLRPLIYGAPLILIAILALVAWGTGLSRSRPEMDAAAGTATRSRESDFSRYIPGENRWLTPWKIVAAAGLVLVVTGIAAMLMP